jgi:hypothetical protein
MTQSNTTRARCWTGHGVATITAQVDPDGTVRVWDSVAGHYTVCHALSPSAQRRIRRLAREAHS